MKKASMYGLVVAGALLAAISTTGVASASKYNTNTKDCSISVVGTSKKIGESNSQFREVGNNSVETTVIVKGDNNCVKTITLASWTAPYGKNSYLPIKDQKLFTSKTFHLKKGTHTLTIAHADCLYQVDMLYGSAVTTSQGTAEYPDAQKLGWVLGGGNVCYPQPPAAPKATPVATTLPATGATDVIAIFALAATAGTLGHYFIVRRRATN